MDSNTSDEKVDKECGKQFPGPKESPSEEAICPIALMDESSSDTIIYTPQCTEKILNDVVTSRLKTVPSDEGKAMEKIKRYWVMRLKRDHPFTYGKRGRPSQELVNKIFDKIYQPKVAIMQLKEFNYIIQESCTYPYEACQPKGRRNQSEPSSSKSDDIIGHIPSHLLSKQGTAKRQRMSMVDRGKWGITLGKLLKFRKRKKSIPSIVSDAACKNKMKRAKSLQRAMVWPDTVEWDHKVFIHTADDLDTGELNLDSALRTSCDIKRAKIEMLHSDNNTEFPEPYPGYSLNKTAKSFGQNKSNLGTFCTSSLTIHSQDRQLEPNWPKRPTRTDMSNSGSQVNFNEVQGVSAFPFAELNDMVEMLPKWQTLTTIEKVCNDLGVMGDFNDSVRQLKIENIRTINFEEFDSYDLAHGNNTIQEENTADINITPIEDAIADENEVLLNCQQLLNKQSSSGEERHITSLSEERDDILRADVKNTNISDVLNSKHNKIQCVRHRKREKNFLQKERVTKGGKEIILKKESVTKERKKIILKKKKATKDTHSFPVPDKKKRIIKSSKRLKQEPKPYVGKLTKTRLSNSNSPQTKWSKPSILNTEDDTNGVYVHKKFGMPRAGSNIIELKNRVDLECTKPTDDDIQGPLHTRKMCAKQKRNCHSGKGEKAGEANNVDLTADRLAFEFKTYNWLENKIRSGEISKRPTTDPKKSDEKNMLSLVSLRNADQTGKTEQQEIQKSQIKEKQYNISDPGAYDIVLKETTDELKSPENTTHLNNPTPTMDRNKTTAQLDNPFSSFPDLRYSQSTEHAQTRLPENGLSSSEGHHGEDKNIPTVEDRRCSNITEKKGVLLNDIKQVSPEGKEGIMAKQKECPMAKEERRSFITNGNAVSIVIGEKELPTGKNELEVTANSEKDNEIINESTKVEPSQKIMRLSTEELDCPVIPSETVSDNLNRTPCSSYQLGVPRYQACSTSEAMRPQITLDNSSEECIPKVAPMVCHTVPDSSPPCHSLPLPPLPALLPADSILFGDEPRVTINSIFRVNTQNDETIGMKGQVIDTELTSKNGKDEQMIREFITTFQESEANNDATTTKMCLEKQFQSPNVASAQITLSELKDEFVNCKNSLNILCMLSQQKQMERAAIRLKTESVLNGLKQVQTLFNSVKNKLPTSKDQTFSREEKTVFPNVLPSGTSNRPPKQEGALVPGNPGIPGIPDIAKHVNQLNVNNCTLKTTKREYIDRGRPETDTTRLIHKEFIDLTGTTQDIAKAFSEKKLAGIHLGPAIEKKRENNVSAQISITSTSKHTNHVIDLTEEPDNVVGKDSESCYIDDIRKRKYIPPTQQNAHSRQTSCALAVGNSPPKAHANKIDLSQYSHLRCVRNQNHRVDPNNTCKANLCDKPFVYRQERENRQSAFNEISLSVPVQESVNSNDSRREQSNFERYKPSNSLAEDQQLVDMESIVSPQLVPVAMLENTTAQIPKSSHERKRPIDLETHFATFEASNDSSRGREAPYVNQPFSASDEGTSFYNTGSSEHAKRIRPTQPGKHQINGSVHHHTYPPNIQVVSPLKGVANEHLKHNHTDSFSFAAEGVDCDQSWGSIKLPPKKGCYFRTGIGFERPPKIKPGTENIVLQNVYTDTQRPNTLCSVPKPDYQAMLKSSHMESKIHSDANHQPIHKIPENRHRQTYANNNTTFFPHPLPAAVIQINNIQTEMASKENTHCRNIFMSNGSTLRSPKDDSVQHNYSTDLTNVRLFERSTRLERVSGNTKRPLYRHYLRGSEEILPQHFPQQRVRPHQQPPFLIRNMSSRCPRHQLQPEAVTRNPTYQPRYHYQPFTHNQGKKAGYDELAQRSRVRDYSFEMGYYLPNHMDPFTSRH